MEKNYKKPQLQVILIEVSDIITASPGTETTPTDECDGVWDLEITV